MPYCTATPPAPPQIENPPIPAPPPAQPFTDHDVMAAFTVLEAATFDLACKAINGVRPAGAPMISGRPDLPGESCDCAQWSAGGPDAEWIVSWGWLGDDPRAVWQRPGGRAFFLFHDGRRETATPRADGTCEVVEGWVVEMEGRP